MISSVWVISHPKKGLWYSPPASNREQAWNNARDWEQFCTGGQPTIDWVDDMKSIGWRAKKAKVQHGTI